MSGAALKALRTHLVAAKTALTAGDLSAARASCSEALSVDGESYDAWTFDGKVAFAQGDVTGALASYRRATDIRDDHPAAWQGIAEASEASGDHALCSTALKTLLKMPADDRAVTEDKRGEWRRRLPVALTQANAWADASDAWTELAENGGDDTAVNTSRRKAAECALSANDENARAAASVAAAEARRTSVTSASELASIEAAAVRAYDAVPDPRLERALRSFLESSACVESSESSTEYVPALHGRLLHRARARTEATGTAADALAAIEEAEAAIARHSRHSPPPRELTEACRAAALESACALDLGLDAEEEGWTDPGTNDAPIQTTSHLDRVTALVSGISGMTPTFESNDHNEVIVAAWLALVAGGGRSGRVAHPPGSAAGAAILPPGRLTALTDALVADECAKKSESSSGVVTTAASEAAASLAAASAPDPLSPGAVVAGWSAACEASYMAGDLNAALDSARRALKACRALRGEGDGCGRMRACERRVRLVAAESLAALGRKSEALKAFKALNDASESPRTVRGLAMCLDTHGETIAALKKAASLAPNAPRPIAELGWAMLRAGGDGAAARATRLLERAAELAATPFVPPDIHAKLGIARWSEACDKNEGDKDECASSRGPGTAHASLLAGAAADGPHRAGTFAYLARLYDTCGDVARGAKCRARALVLDPTDSTAGPDECARLDAAGDDAAVLRICGDALRVQPRCLWAAVRLAPASSRAGDHEGAVVALQTVLRAVPDSSAAWEALGAAYDALSKHSAALKAYRRAVEIESNFKHKPDGGSGRVFASTQSGRIMHQMGAVSEAIAAYESALAVVPGHTAALLGLAAAELQRSYNDAAYAPGSAIASAARAADAATTAAAAPGPDAPKRSAVKLLGDALLVIARCRDPAVAMDRGGTGRLDQSNKSSSAVTRAEDAETNAVHAARRARRAYARGVHLDPNTASAWRDLAGACAAEGDASPHDAKTSCRLSAERCLRGALRVDSADPATWTALGTLGGADPGVDPVRGIARRETALARAVTLDPRCAPAWTALSRLYLARADSAETEPEERDDFISRARRALDNARAAEPGNAHAWLGTALLHSARGDEGEAAGAFRMASGLGAGVEADVGRALSGLRASSGRYRAADTDGAFKPRPTAGTKVTSAGGCYAAARRAVEAAPADPTARLALALAAEAKGLFEEAAAAFDDATSLSRAASSNGGGVYDVVAREASEGVERTRSRLDGSPAIDTRVGALSIDPTASGESVVASVAASADNLRSTVTAAATARRVFRDRCESHAHVAAVEACVGTACSLAGDPDTAVRFLARAVHSDPGSVAFRGELARVATCTSRGHAVTAAGSLVPAPSAQSVVTPTYTSPEACAIARYATVASTVHAAAAAIASKGGPCAMKDVGTSLAKAYHLSPCGTSGEDAYALLALVAARRAAVGDGGGGVPGVRAWESKGGSPSSNFRLAAAGRAAAAAETVASRNAHLACATLCAASESAMVECTDTALVYARRCAQVGAGKGPVPATAASTQIARCLWAAGDDAGCAAELRSAVAVGAAPPGFNSATSTPAVVAGARDVAASHLALLLPSGSTGADVSSAPCVIVSQACAALAAGDFKRAESLLRDAQRHAVESTVRRGGVQPYLGSTSRALLGSTLLARSMPTERGGGGEPKCAKEAGKILAKAMRGTKHLLGDGSSLAAACGTLEALAKA